MRNLRQQLVIATASAWAACLLINVLGLTSWYTQGVGVPASRLLASLVAQLLQWLGIILGVGAVATHVLMTRDGELYGEDAPAEDTVD